MAMTTNSANVKVTRSVIVGGSSPIQNIINTNYKNEIYEILSKLVNSIEKQQEYHQSAVSFLLYQKVSVIIFKKIKLYF